MGVGHSSSFEIVVSDSQVFVGRDRELERLDEFLAQTLAGHGQVCFLAGEAGAGKSALIAEFSRRAQQAHKELIVAAGVCNDLDGKGDPYLPFREVLSLLTGDVEAAVAEGAPTPTSASRLTGLIARSGQILVDIAPDLINVVIPGSRVVAVAGKAIASRVGWLQKLDGLAGTEPTPSTVGEPALQPDRIYQEFAAFLLQLSETDPILISIDDLQWMDNASAGLFFHLARKIEPQRIMLLGAYRSDVISHGREGDRHPLEPILSEIMRYRGRATIDLSQAGQAEGRSFVDALLDTEPNVLDEPFRQALHRHTEGHPLFTTELLTSMRQRGDLLQDQAGRWIARPGIDWSALPERIEGIVAERVARLGEADRELLKAACVQGDTFTAEVIARVLGQDARQVVGRLSTVLSQGQGLVSGGSVRRVGVQRLSSYSFRHHLFQQYLYGLMDEAQRSYLHEDVAQALVALYGEDDEAVIGQLAFHYRAAGVVDLAFKYSVAAGDRAAAVYASADALGHYAAASELLSSYDPSSDQLIHFFSHYGRALELAGQLQRALECYEEMERLAARRDDRVLRLASLAARSVLLAIPTPVHDPEAGQKMATQALELAREIGDPRTEARLLWSLLLVHWYTGQASDAVAFGERSLELSRRLDLREQLAFTLTDLAAPYSVLGQMEKARAALAEARSLWEASRNQPMLANAIAVDSQLCLLDGKLEEAIALADDALRISRAIGNLSGISFGQTVIGLALREQGLLGQAIARLRDAVDQGTPAGNALATTGVRAELAWTLACVGALEEATTEAEKALNEARSRYPAAFGWTSATLARIRLRTPDRALEPSWFAETSRTLSEELMRRSFVVGGPPVGLASVEIALANDDPQTALASSEQLILFLKEAGGQLHLPEALQLRSKAMLRQGALAQARQALEEARKIAEASGSRRVLWSILDDLAAIAADHGDAPESSDLRKQAQIAVQYVLDHIDEERYRSTFRRLPAVQRLTASPTPSPPLESEPT
jgi:tetratricopeptide (TPR) repeat protein